MTELEKAEKEVTHSSVKLHKADLDIKQILIIISSEEKQFERTDLTSFPFSKVW